MKTAERAGLLIACLVLISPRAWSQELVTGWEGGPSNGYAFVSPIFTAPISKENLFLVRPTVSYLYYNFPDVGGTTDVSSPGTAVQIGYRLQLPRLTFTIGPGVEVRWERRNLGSGSTINTTQIGATAEADAFFQATSLTNLNIISNFETANHYFWTRAGIKRLITNTNYSKPVGLSIGIDLTGQGNHDLHQLEAGGLLELGFPRANSSMQFRVGYDHQWFANNSANAKPYFGVGFYHRF
jgi:hypothetical protein